MDIEDTLFIKVPDRLNTRGALLALLPPNRRELPREWQRRAALAAAAQIAALEMLQEKVMGIFLGQQVSLR